MKIETSLDWSKVEYELRRKTYKLAFGRDVRRMIENISKDVAELSKAEVELRRGKKLKAQELVTKINNDIEVVEEFLLMAALIG